MSGLGSFVTPFEAVFSKPADGSAAEGGVLYELHIEKSTMQIQAMQYGIISGRHSTVANTADILQKIAQHSSQGGRLVCVEMTGALTSQGMGSAMQGISEDMGVDLFFNVPRTPNPPLFLYQAVSVPIGFRVHPGLSTSVTVDCNFMGHFAGHLNHGWKLVEIFLDKGMQAHGGFSMSAQLNSVWFFEKETSKINDPTPVYEGTIVSYEHSQANYLCHYLSLLSGFGGVKVKSDWTPLIQQM